MPIVEHPLHRSGRAALPHPAPTLGGERQALVGVRMTDMRGGVGRIRATSVSMMTMGQTYADWGKRTEARALHDELMTMAHSQWVSPGVRAFLAATAGLTDDVVTLITRAIGERDPFLMFAMGTWPLTEWPRRVLREAGTLDEIRRQLGRPSND